MTGTERGFSLIELLVTAVLVSIALLLAAQLLVASSRVGRAASNVLRDPSSGRFGVWIRRDMDTAIALPPTAGAWSVLALDLGLEDGTTVRYDLINGTMVRTVLGAPGLPGAGDRLLHGVLSWRWRVISERILVLEVKLPRHLEEVERIGATSSSEPGARTERLTVARRGLDGGRSW